MNNLVELIFNNKKVNYIEVKEDPWFRANDVAIISSKVLQGMLQLKC